MSSSLKTRKSNLLEKSKNFKKALSRDFSEIKENSKEIGIASLYVVGVVALGYLAYKLISSSSRNNDVVDEPGSSKIVYVNAGSGNTIFNEIMKSIAIFLLGIAKQKLMEYLEERNKKSD